MTATGMVGISLAVKEGQGYYIPVGHGLQITFPFKRLLMPLHLP
ncbi:MAG: hypothetical protein U0X74_16410 [Anaerolineales bacterium]